MTTATAVREDERSAFERALADDAAFSAWYARTLPRVFAYLLSRCGGDRVLAEDLTQETYAAAIDRRHGYDGRADPVTWLCGIGRHKLADHFRRLERDERRQLQLEVREVVLADAAERSHFERVEERTAIETALATLPASQRAALLFSDLDGLSVREVADLLGRSTGATQSLITRARENFRRAYREVER